MARANSTPDYRRVYETHGVVFSNESDDELIGYCPFTDRDDKFYVNQETWLWDSKTAGFGGNVTQFLERTAKRYATTLRHDPTLYKPMAKDRGLPVRAFKNWGLGWTGNRFAMPIRNAGGTITDIRLWEPGGRLMSTPNCKTGMLGAEHLPSRPGAPVYLCEGEWDAIALRYLMHTQGLEEPIVLGVPGAGTFKADWAAWLSGRMVHVLYDADTAGITGEQKVFQRLKSSAQAMTFCHWPSGAREGFDVRDAVVAAVKTDKLKEAWHALQKYSHAWPRELHPLTVEKDPEAILARELALIDEEEKKKNPSPWNTKTPKLKDVFDVFNKWLFLDSMDAIVITLATYISQRIDGPPVWMFLVGPPGSAKTETLTSLAQAAGIYMTSTLTPHALISGANWKDNVDPSLIPRLNDKVMVIKDFTSILSMRDMEKDEIFGILRDAYDGRCGKVFGTGIERSYESRFTIIAAVTPRIHDLTSQHTSLGERFLKFSVGDNLNHASEDDIISRAIDNIARDTTMKAELQDVVRAYLAGIIPVKNNGHAWVPDLSPEMKTRIISLGKFGARMRGTVSRDTYHNEIMTGRPSAEVGSRLGIQLAKLAKAIALILKHPTVTEEEFRLVRKTVIDTIPQRTEDIIRHLLVMCPTTNDWVTTPDIAQETRYPQATVARIMQDLTALDVVSRQGTAFKHKYTVSAYIRKAAMGAKLYGPVAPRVRVRRRLIAPTRA
jgi:hypothetical protein